MYSGLLIILVPLILGYFIPVKKPALLQMINKLLSWMVYVILFIMGISLAFLDNLSTNLVMIFKYTAVFFVCIFAVNLFALWLLERRKPWKSKYRQEALPSQRHILLDSLRLCFVVVAGFALGLTQWQWLTYASDASQAALIFLLVLVGAQLGNSSLTLRQIILNRRGMLVASVVCIASLGGGLIAAWILGLPLKTGLAMASGYGWYSLSGIVLTDSFGPVIGSAAFFNDLARELCAIMLIPTLVRSSRSSALGLCGATSMDFTLPMLQRSGGLDMVPPAVVHGFVLSLLAPVLMAVFSS